MPSSPLIRLEGIFKSFLPDTARPRHVLHDVTLSVDEGEFVSIVGFTGCGKSTLLKIASGLLAPDQGKVWIGGERLEGVRRETAIVFQNYSLLPWFSALENVRLAVEATFPSWSRQRQREQASRYLELVGLGDALHRRPKQLSGGMRQRVAIARAFAAEPSLLFLDEPFGALDALTRGVLQTELAALCSAIGRPVTTIMITNNVSEALLLSDRIVPMTRGPRATVAEPVTVTLPRPRTASGLLHDDEAVRLQARVIDSLNNVAGDRVRNATSAARTPQFSSTEPAMSRPAVSPS